ncbi:MAG: Adenine phosphoribosyltransferase [Candidatus Tokpelaia hoelldobleri]|uniref:Adenine phosphoribosyltransferase n=1 Tax=Candidatus Tokpelaia hoelldobleri TaxID=1902579 RepID=A0A1U9JVL6_9HYPH|nr:MAG: Adenine phosphoribosyltransferase [Candidatus Tokpelaia hoelldoblerii]
MSEQTLAQTLRASIRTIDDYPKPGVKFYDITTLLGNAQAFRRAIDALVYPYVGQGIDKVAGVEARGFILRVAYSLEYGIDEMEIHSDAVRPGEQVLLVDDLIASGGTAVAAVKLLQKMQANIVGACFVMDLPELGGAEKLRALGVDVRSLVAFAGK